MRKNIILSAAVAAILTACGAGEDQAALDISMTEPSGDDVTYTAEKDTDRGMMEKMADMQGALPQTAPPEDVASVQARLVQYLSEGIAATHFSDDVVAWEDAVVSSTAVAAEAWRMEDGKPVMYLVHRHLEFVSDTDELAPFCEDGELYSGFAAARPYLSSSVMTEAMSEEAVTPYGLLICDRNPDLEIKLVPSDHTIFGKDSLPHQAAKVKL